MRCMVGLAAAVVWALVLFSASSASAQQEIKFLGWASDGQAVVRNVNAEDEPLLHCKPARLGRFDTEHSAPDFGCTPCKGAKECAVSGEPAPSVTSPDGKVRAESAKENAGILMLTVAGEAPRRLAMHATKKATIRTWFRPDNKAFVIMVYDAEDRLYAVDLTTLPAVKSAK